MDFRAILRWKEVGGLRNTGYEKIMDEFMKALKNHFGDRISSFKVIEQTDTPIIYFRFEFSMYKYFSVVFDFERTRFGCAILVGSRAVGLENSQEWYDNFKMKTFLKELQEQIELRIPDKFLEYNGWK